MKNRQNKKESLHKLPEDFKNVIRSNLKVKAQWNDITPLARNEWICWIISVKKSKTRERHIKRATDELKAGKRRPCCFAGCPHRKLVETSRDS